MVPECKVKRSRKVLALDVRKQEGCQSGCWRALVACTSGMVNMQCSAQV
jgi:hypothetical protein